MVPGLETELLPFVVSVSKQVVGIVGPEEEAGQRPHRDFRAQLGSGWGHEWSEVYGLS